MEESSNSFDKKRVLITGGAGFIGSHLCDKLLSEDCHVICLDNLYTGHKSNIINLMSNRDFEFIEHDIVNPINLNVDEIYNLACPASPKHYQKNPLKTLKTSIYGSINMLDLAEKSNATILQASTSEVYGDPAVHPQVESYWGNVNPIGYRACYDEGKRVAETLFFDFQRGKDVHIKIARIFNTYGPKMHPDDGRVVANFISQAIKNEVITIYGDGNQTRSFCYIDDLTEALFFLMNSDQSLSGPMNLGNPEEFTILELADIIIELTGSSSKLQYQPLPPDDPVRRQPSIELAKTKIKWQPTISLTEGIKKTIPYFNQILRPIS